MRGVEHLISSRSKYTYLLVSLLILFLLGPIEQLMGMSFPLDALLFLITIVLMLRALLTKRRWLVLSIAAAVVAFFITIMAGSGEDRLDVPLLVVGCLLYIGLLSACIYTMLSNLIGERQIHKDTLIGGVCVYFLIGHVWSLLYIMIHALDPQAFVSHHTNPLKFADFQYYSFTVLSTLGYGDIVPINPLARSLGSLEVITGQLFLAIFIARLMGLYLSQERER